MYIGKATLLENVSVLQGTTAYTRSTPFLTSGYCHVILTSTGGSLTITKQGSFDDNNWYDAVNQYGESLGLVCMAQTITAGKYIIFAPLLSKYVRFKVIENNVGNSTVTLSVYMGEQ